MHTCRGHRSSAPFPCTLFYASSPSGCFWVTSSTIKPVIWSLFQILDAMDHLHSGNWLLHSSIQESSVQVYCPFKKLDWGKRPRWWSRKTLSSPHLTRTQKSQQYAEQLSLKMSEIYQEKKKSTTKDLKKEPHWDRQEEQICHIIKSLTSRWVPHTLETNYVRGSPAGGARALSPMPAPAARGSSTGRRAPTGFGFEGQQGLTAGAPQDWGK